MTRAESKTAVVYSSKFWPTPTTPARVHVDLDLTQEKSHGGKHYWSFFAKVRLPDGSDRGVGSAEMEAENKQHAELKAMYELVTLLGEVLADVTKGMEPR